MTRATPTTVQGKVLRSNLAEYSTTTTTTWKKERGERWNPYTELFWEAREGTHLRENERLNQTDRQTDAQQRIVWNRKFVAGRDETTERERERERERAEMLRTAINKSRLSAARGIWAQGRQLQAFSSAAKELDLDGNLSLQKARSWDEGVESKFSVTPLKDIFKNKKVVVFGLPGAFTGVCTKAHVPSYVNNADKLKAKGVEKIICVSVNDPYVMKGWADKLNASDKLEFYGDFDGSFHKSLDLTVDLTFALMGQRSTRWSALIDDGKIQVLNVENTPGDFKVSDAETLLKKI